MKGLLRVVGLLGAFGLVSFTSVDAWPYDYGYDSCYYYCDDYSTQQVWTSWSECCSASSHPGWCPPGETPIIIGWGGTYTPLGIC